MIDRRNCLRLLLIDSNNHFCNRHCRRFCSMAAAAAAAFCMSCKDPHPHFSVQKFSSAAASSPFELSSNGSGRGRSISLRLKGCYSSESSRGRNNNSSKSSGFSSNNAGATGFELHKARATSPSLPHQLLRELEPDEIRLTLRNRFHSGGADGSGACHMDRGSCLQSAGDRLLSEKIVVAVDVDEVLGNFVSALNQFIADRYSLNRSVSEYHVYEFFKIWQCSRDEADTRVHEFFKTPYFTKGIHPIPGALQALQKLSRFYSLSIVTSRQNAIKDHTVEWIEKHYPGLFEEIHFGNHFALDGQSKPKSEICRSLGAKVLIDDNPRYAIECAEVGIKVLLFDYDNSYPWCKMESVEHHPLVTKVHNWEEIEHQLVSWTKS